MSSDYARRYDEAKAAQTEALAEYGFGSAFAADSTFGFGGTEFTHCLTCGAAIPLRLDCLKDDGTPTAEHPLNVHLRWHRGSFTTHESHRTAPLAPEQTAPGDEGHRDTRGRESGEEEA